MSNPYQPKKGDERLIAALARGLSYQQAADETGLSLRTITRRMADAGFRKAVHDCRVAMLDGATGRLADAAGDAIDTLRDLAKSADSEQARVSAARALASYILPLREQLDLQTRLEALERKLDEQESQPSA